MDKYETIDSIMLIMYIETIYFTFTPKYAYTQTLKGIVHPKIKIMSLITHPHVVPNL